VGLQSAIIDWLDARFELTDAVDAELYRRVPNYAAATYRYLGGVAVFLVAIEFITGFLLGLYYVPDGAGNPAPAYASVVFIQHAAYLGWLIRGIHFWGANLLIAIAFLHMTFVFWNGGYRPPRELNWMVGVLVFLIIVLFSFTGSLLPWDANSYLARAREISIISEERHEIDANVEASVHQVRIEVASESVPADGAARERVERRILERAEHWARACIADRHVDVA